MACYRQCQRKAEYLEPYLADQTSDQRAVARNVDELALEKLARGARTAIVRLERALSVCLCVLLRAW